MDGVLFFFSPQNPEGAKRDLGVLSNPSAPSPILLARLPMSPKKIDLGSLKTKIKQNIKIKFPIVCSLALRGASRWLSAFSEPGIGYGPRSAWGFPVSSPAAEKSPRRAERSLAGTEREVRGKEGGGEDLPPPPGEKKRLFERISTYQSIQNIYKTRKSLKNVILQYIEK